MKTVRILILEDDLETVSLILKKLSQLEKELEASSDQRVLSVVTLSEYTQVEEFINKNKYFDFDIVLLDRDCKLGGSFHTLNIEAIGPEKIISISSTPPYNEEASKRGVIRVVHKNYEKLEEFSEQVIKTIKELLLI